jgi:hypothetical protein
MTSSLEWIILYMSSKVRGVKDRLKYDNEKGEITIIDIMSGW